jgi:hypothetical protein
MAIVPQAVERPVLLAAAVPAVMEALADTAGAIVRTRHRLLLRLTTLHPAAAARLAV